MVESFNEALMRLSAENKRLKEELKGAYKFVRRVVVLLARDKTKHEAAARQSIKRVRQIEVDFRAFREKKR